MHEKEVMLDPRDAFVDTAPPIGLDPVWQLAENKIQFLNAYKMKVSIIVGVIHMLFGVAISLWNHRFFQRRINVICEFIPQVIFMTFLFFYLCLLVFHKWTSYSALDGSFFIFVDHSINYDSLQNNNVNNVLFADGRYGAHCAPSILITFINMVLFKDPEGADPAKEDDPNACWPYMYAGQRGFQRFLVVIGLFCVPWMLAGKPYLIYKQRQLGLGAAKTETAGLVEDGQGGMMEQQQVQPAPPADPHGEEEFSDICIHQAIHTIEYVLGCVSNTASYLRLWALSLAHARKSL